jgi:hypothetical protein
MFFQGKNMVVVESHCCLRSLQCLRGNCWRVKPSSDIRIDQNMLTTLDGRADEEQKIKIRVNKEFRNF